MSVILCQTVESLKKTLKEQRKGQASVALVPTMGALHEGHATLIRQAAQSHDVVVVSVFVNPTQFGPNEDFESYPRTLDNDLALAGDNGATIVFAPTKKELYPSEEDAWVEVTGNVTKVLCGRTRPIHFRGVTTVVTKLINLVQPDQAYFGQKDAQQVQVLRRMVKDFFMNVELVIVPIVREEDGLAKSSRNAYLSEKERQEALVLSQAIKAIEKAYQEGERSNATLTKLALETIARSSIAQVEYAEFRDMPELPLSGQILEGPVLFAMAVRFGQTRLIDNTILGNK